MGIRLVLGGIGKGSMFRYGRVLGVHNPFGSDIGKARDPFINLKTLAKLSHDPDLQIRKTVVENLTRRLERGNFDSRQLSEFDRNTVVASFVKATSLGWPWAKDYDGVDIFIAEASSDELTDLSKSSCVHVLVEVANNKKTPRRILISLSIERMNERAGMTSHSISIINSRAFDSLDYSTLTSEELRDLSNTSYSETLEKIAVHPNTPPDVLEKLATESNVRILRGVANNTSTPRTTLFRLALTVQCHILEIKNQWDALLSRNIDFDVALDAFDALDRLSPLSSDELVTLADSVSYQVLIRIAKHPNRPPEIKGKLWEKLFVRHQILGDAPMWSAYGELRDTFTPEDLTTIAESDHWEVCNSALADSRIPEDAAKRILLRKPFFGIRLYQVYERIKDSLTSNDLDRLAQNYHDDSYLEDNPIIINHPRISDKALSHILQVRLRRIREGVYRCEETKDKFVDILRHPNMSQVELRKLSLMGEVRSKKNYNWEDRFKLGLIAYERLEGSILSEMDAREIAEIINNNILKSDVITGYESYTYTTGPDHDSDEVEHEGMRAITEFKYPEEDLKLSSIFLKPHSPEKQREIMEKLREVNPELAGLLS